MKKAPLLFLLLCSLLLLPQRAHALEGGSAGPRMIGVELAAQAAAVDFSVTGDYRLTDAATGRTVAVPGPQEKWQVRAQGGRLAVFRNGRPVDSVAGPLLVRESPYRAFVLSGSGTVAERDLDEGAFIVGADGQVRPLQGDLAGLAAAGAGGVSPVGGKKGQNLVTLFGGDGSSRYRGSLEIRIGEKGLTVVNRLPLEEYLYGVVPAEMPAGWPAEALKAQAVAARSYALAQIKRRGGSPPPADILATQASQVYRGYDWETPATNRAVDDTRGVVLTYRGVPAEAYFHCSSGGFTENSEDVWKNRLDYVRTRPDPFDLNEKHYNWQVSYTKDELIKQLAKKEYQFKDIFDLTEKERTASGKRVKRLAVSGLDKEGRPATVEIANADEVRIALGLKSALFTMTKEFDAQKKLAKATFKGSGWGHGLGMSQYGALGMARKGYTYQDILKYYYSGVTIASDYGGQK